MVLRSGTGCGRAGSLVFLVIDSGRPTVRVDDHGQLTALAHPVGPAVLPPHGLPGREGDRQRLPSSGVPNRVLPEHNAEGRAAVRVLDDVFGPADEGVPETIRQADVKAVEALAVFAK